MFDFQEFIQSSTRIFNVSRKPDTKEFSAMAKVTGLGIILIGVIAFIVRFILSFVF
ncbi:MAG: protein translocase SEC61 complex subunit gamma [Candidatus Diapherotrites archaeon CG11_big_fil_rev_8_21_14_0_20_37_9]|nr:MAG: protein translocase SEC61 complex subunit gamma [Candidatus Diapherotrites archaeon CG11_big_fil_rev_8_21_14_0_20_37_9]